MLLPGGGCALPGLQLHRTVPSPPWGEGQGEGKEQTLKRQPWGLPFAVYNAVQASAHARPAPGS